MYLVLYACSLSIPREKLTTEHARKKSDTLCVLSLGGACFFENETETARLAASATSQSAAEGVGVLWCCYHSVVYAVITTLCCCIIFFVSHDTSYVVATHTVATQLCCSALATFCFASLPKTTCVKCWARSSCYRRDPLCCES